MQSCVHVEPWVEAMCHLLGHKGTLEKHVCQTDKSGSGVGLWLCPYRLCYLEQHQWYLIQSIDLNNAADEMSATHNSHFVYSNSGMIQLSFLLPFEVWYFPSLDNPEYCSFFFNIEHILLDLLWGTEWPFVYFFCGMVDRCWCVSLCPIEGDVVCVVYSSCYSLCWLGVCGSFICEATNIEVFKYIWMILYTFIWNLVCNLGCSFLIFFLPHRCNISFKPLAFRTCVLMGSSLSHACLR